MRSGIAGGS